MGKWLWSIGAVSVVLLGLSLVSARPAGAQTGTPTAPSPTQDPDKVKRGKYLTDIIGCSDCHTPVDPNTLQPIESKRWSGGQAFALDPAGAQVVYSKNLTADPDTGIGSWSDEQIKLAITQGIDKDGKRLYPVMPYQTFNNMSDNDLDAIVAYLRTIPAIKNQVTPDHLLPDTQYPPVQPHKPDNVAPDPKNTAARGVYLMTALLTCGDCHTPIDPQTGAPDTTKYLAGGQPFEGPWGVVYGGNITPDQKTGIASWNDDDIRKLIQAGVRQDGRVAIVMPRVYANLTDDDLTAMIHYLRNNVKPVENEVPKADLKPNYVMTAPTDTAGQSPAHAGSQAATQALVAAPTTGPTSAAGSGGSGGSTTLVIVAVIAVLAVGGGLVLMTRNKPGGG